MCMEWWLRIVRTIIVPLHETKGDQRECKNHRWISLLSVVRKMYGKIVIPRVRKVNEYMVNDKQDGF